MGKSKIAIFIITLISFTSLVFNYYQYFQSQEDYRVIKGNIDKATYEKFYHLPECKHYNQVIMELDIGEKYFCSEKEAKKAGFKKASGCS